MRNYTNVLPDLATIPVSDFEDAKMGQECVITVGKSQFTLTPVPGQPGRFTQRWLRTSHRTRGRLSKAWDPVLDYDDKPTMFRIDQAKIITDRNLTIRTDGYSQTYRVYDAMLRRVEPRRR